MLSELSYFFFFLYYTFKFKQISRIRSHDINFEDTFTLDNQSQVNFFNSAGLVTQKKLLFVDNKQSAWRNKAWLLFSQHY